MEEEREGRRGGYFLSFFGEGENFEKIINAIFFL